MLRDALRCHGRVVAVNPGAPPAVEPQAPHPEGVDATCSHQACGPGRRTRTVCHGRIPQATPQPGTSPKLTALASLPHACPEQGDRPSTGTSDFFGSRFSSKPRRQLRANPPQSAGPVTGEGRPRGPPCALAGFGPGVGESRPAPAETPPAFSQETYRASLGLFGPRQ